MPRTSTVSLIVGRYWSVEQASVTSVRRGRSGALSVAFRWAATVRHRSGRVERRSGVRRTRLNALRALRKAVRAVTGAAKAHPGRAPAFRARPGDPLIVVQCAGRSWEWGARVVQSQHARRAVRGAGLEPVGETETYDLGTPDARHVVRVARASLPRLALMEAGVAPRLLPCGKPQKPTKRRPLVTPFPQARPYLPPGWRDEPEPDPLDE